jgi:hypothetical protein
MVSPSMIGVGILVIGGSSFVHLLPHFFADFLDR